MVSHLPLLVCGVLVVLSGVRGRSGEDDCHLRLEEDHPQPHECCRVKQGIIPTILLNETNQLACREKYPLRYDPGGAAPPQSEVMRAVACMSECMFARAGLLRRDKRLNKTAVGRAFKEGVDRDLSPMVSSAVAKCLATTKGSARECASGAAELEVCVMRQSFLICPDSLWSADPKCEALRRKVIDCPKYPVVLIPSPQES